MVGKLKPFCTLPSVWSFAVRHLSALADKEAFFSAAVKVSSGHLFYPLYTLSLRVGGLPSPPILLFLPIATRSWGQYQKRFWDFVTMNCTEGAFASYCNPAVACQLLLLSDLPVQPLCKFHVLIVRQAAEIAPVHEICDNHYHCLGGGVVAVDEPRVRWRLPLCFFHGTLNTYSPASLALPTWRAIERSRRCPSGTT